MVWVVFFSVNCVAGYAQDIEDIPDISSFNRAMLELKECSYLPSSFDVPINSLKSWIMEKEKGVVSCVWSSYSSALPYLSVWEVDFKKQIVSKYSLKEMQGEKNYKAKKHFSTLDVFTDFEENHLFEMYHEIIKDFSHENNLLHFNIGQKNRRHNALKCIKNVFEKFFIKAPGKP